MHLISRTTALLLTGAVLLVTACQEPTSQGEAAVANLDHKGKPHGGGGGGGGNKPPDPVPKRVTIPADVRAGTANMIVPDLFGPYDHEVCGVKAVVEGEAGLFAFRPKVNGLTRKNIRDLERECPDEFPREAQFVLAQADVHIVNPADPDDHSLDKTLLDAITAGLARSVDPDNDDELLKTAKVRGLNLITGKTKQGESFNLRYCLDFDNRGSPFRFNSGVNPATSDLEIVPDGDVFHVRTQPYPANVGACEHTLVEGITVELLLHIDLAYDISPIT